MNYYLALIPLLFGFNVFAQSDTLNQVDENGLKQGYWIHYGSEKPEDGYLEMDIYEEGHYVDNQKQGYWKRYNPGGILRLHGHYENGKPCGHYTKYYPNGTISEDGNYCDQKCFGELKRYNSNGSLKAFETYDMEGNKIDTCFYYSEFSTLERMEIYDSITGLVVVFGFDDFGNKTDNFSAHYVHKEKFFRLKNFIDTTAEVPTGIPGSYYCIMRYEGTNIFQEYILIIEPDLNYKVVSNVDESCYNVLNQYGGVIEVSDTEIMLSYRGELPKYLNIEAFGFESVPVLKYNSHRVTYRFKKGRLNPDFRIPD